MKPDASIRPYRPSNGTEEMQFTSQFCDRCVKHPLEPAPPCPILGASLLYDIGDDEYPKEWQYTASGDPTCTAFEISVADWDYSVEWIKRTLEDGSTRDDVVPAYASLIRALDSGRQCLQINDLIIEKWSIEGLRYIKAEAWKAVAA